MRFFILLFIVVPLIEIFALVKIGSVIGSLWTIAAVIGTAIAGAVLVRHQGAAAVQRLSGALARGELPALTILEGFLLLVSGILLLTPGFFTDLIGFLFLIPGLRVAIVKWALKYIIPKFTTVSAVNPSNKNSVDGEFRRID